MSLKLWRKIHIYSFGYLKTVSVLTTLIMVVIFVTGVLLNHRHEMKFMETAYVPVSVLPARYAEDVARINAAQADIPGPKLTGVPVATVVLDLHTGDILGPWGRWLYDLVAVMMLVLAISGVYLYLVVQSRKKTRRPPPQESES